MPPTEMDFEDPFSGRSSRRAKAVALAIPMILLCLRVTGMNVGHVVSLGSSGGSRAKGPVGNASPNGNESESRVRFIPHPHRSLGSGAQVRCRWETRPTDDASATDYTQSTALAEGVCIPPALGDGVHVFSSEEAVECLSRGREGRLIFSGDSYMKQLYVGMVDILLSEHVSNGTEITGFDERNEVVSAARQLVRDRLWSRNSTFPKVQYLCERECYGRVHLSKCSKCIDDFSGKKTGHVWVVGVGIHVMKRTADRNEEAINNATNEQLARMTALEITKFLRRERKRMIYVSPPSYGHSEDYKDQKTRMGRLYLNLLPHVAPRRPGQPFLDVYELTRSCHMENCSYDGGHRSRYVNRWKAQMLLNQLCQVVEGRKM